MGEKKTLQDHVTELNYAVYEIGAEINNLNNIKNTLGRIAINADEMKGTDKEKYFLYDNNDTLQIVNDYLYHVLDVMCESKGEIERTADVLFDVLVKGDIPISTVGKECECMISGAENEH